MNQDGIALSCDSKDCYQLGWLNKACDGFGSRKKDRSATQCSMNSKPPQKRMAKLKCSIYFLHLFFRVALNFPNVKNSNCFHHGSTDVCKHTGKGRTFTPMNSSSAKIHESVSRLLRQPIHGFGCVAHKRIYSQWLQRYMMPSVFL